MMDDIRRTIIENARVRAALDEQLVDALFAPAVKLGLFEFAGLTWRNPASKWRAESLINDLLPLSEFYADINAPLSAALWGIWNTTRYLRRERSLFAILFESRKKDEQAFIGVHALAATAALQFADGTAFTVTTSDAMNNIAAYRKHAEKAIHHLSLVR
jgi:hypothetical protein